MIKSNVHRTGLSRKMDVYITGFIKCTGASYLLVNKENVKTVAHTVGYEDEKAFSRSFKKIKGVPPSQYKKRKYLNP